MRLRNTFAALVLATLFLPNTLLAQNARQAASSRNGMVATG